MRLPRLGWRRGAGHPGGNEMAGWRASAVFSLTMAAVLEPTYQWCCDGSAIGGATNATLSLSTVNSGTAENYTVTVTNDLGSVTSDAARLTVTSGGTSGGGGGLTGGGGGGGGGGAPSWWFVADVTVLLLGRAVRSRRLRAA